MILHARASARSRRSHTPTLPESLKPFRVSLIFRDTEAASCLSESLQAQNLTVDTYLTGREFLRDPDAQKPGVIVVQLQMRDQPCGDFLKSVQQTENAPLVTFAASHHYAPESIQLLSEGAFDYVLYPLTEKSIIAAVTRAYRSWYEIDAEDLEWLSEQFEAGYQRLTAREEEVLAHIAMGKTSRVIADELGVSAKTVEAHRSKINDKLRADDLGHVVRMWRTANR